MQNQNLTAPNKEMQISAISGWLMLAINLALFGHPLQLTAVRSFRR